MSLRSTLAMAVAPLLGLLLAGCPNGEEPVEPVVPAEKLEPAPLTAPSAVVGGPDTRLTCLGKNAPPAVTGNALELTGYVRALADPDADAPPPAAKIDAFTPDGTRLGGGFADPAPGKDGRVSFSIPITDDGFTGHAMVTMDGYLDYRFQNSRPITSVDFGGWAWLTTQTEVDERATLAGVTLEAGTGILYGAVHDCDNFGVEHAFVTIDGGHDGVYYVEGFGIATDRTWTSDTGRFVVPNLAPGTVRVKAFGRLVPDGPLTLLSTTTATVEAGAISAVNLEPRIAAE